MQLTDLCRQLRLDNNQLKARVTDTEAECRELKYRLDETRARIENLVARLPTPHTGGDGA